MRILGDSSTPCKVEPMKTLATHPELVRAWLFALGGLPMPALPAAPQAVPVAPVHPPEPPLPPYRH
jgi:hypothetical protein